MIYDMTDVIISISTSYTLKTYETIEYNGITYRNVVSTGSILGVMVPLTSDDRVEILNMGHSISGHMNFYSPVSQGKLTENHSIVDSNNVEWNVEPYNASYEDTCAVIKYRLIRK